MNETFKGKELKIAQIKYYEEGKGFEVTNVQPFVIIKEIPESDNIYCNIFDERDKRVFIRTAPYSNTTKDGVDFGQKYFAPKDKQLLSQFCFTEVKKQSYLEDDKDYSLEDLVDVMLMHDDVFFKDREEFVAARLDTLENLFMMKKANCNYIDLRKGVLKEDALEIMKLQELYAKDINDQSDYRKFVAEKLGKKYSENGLGVKSKVLK